MTADEYDGALGRERCPLCARAQRCGRESVGALTYWRCPGCDLTFLEPAQRPSADEERAEYALHDNDPADRRYREFLRPAIEPLLPRLPDGARGLDFGCGPGPAIAAILAERGFDVVNYDPMFEPNVAALAASYDFITCTEVVEHLHSPAAVFAQLDDLLEPGGWISIMTERRQPDRDFATWRYRRERTHVCFYSDQTMHWIATHHRWRVTLCSPTVALFEKPS